MIRSTLSAHDARATSPRPDRRGMALYSLVMIQALLVGLLMLSALGVARNERRIAMTSTDRLVARQIAFAAIDQAMAQIKATPSWRNTFTHQTLSPAVSMSGGTMQWRLIDTVDTSLSNNPRHPVLVQGIGRVGEAVWVESVEARQAEVPLPTLSTAVHSEGNLRIDSGASLEVLNGEASCNQELNIQGTLSGNATSRYRNGSGPVYGVVTISNTGREAVNAANVLSHYRNLATSLGSASGLNREVLSSGTNTLGATVNTDGVYSITSSSSTFTIQNTRVVGTLIVKGNTSITGTALLQSGRRDYPVLIVEGDLTISLNSQDYLNEITASRNFNPAGTPFLNDSDMDQSDRYPSEIQGLVFVTGQTRIEAPTRIYGTLICQGEVRVTSNAMLHADPVIPFSVPQQFWTQTPGHLELKPGKWQRAAAP